MRKAFHDAVSIVEFLCGRRSSGHKPGILCFVEIAESKVKPFIWRKLLINYIDAQLKKYIKQ